MRNRNKGFTVIEIALVFFILSLVATIVTFSFSKLNSKQALDRSADLVVSILDEARSLSLSSASDSQYGVHFEDLQVVLFKGSTYSSSDSSNVITRLNSLVSLGDITLSGGGTDVVFKRLTGQTDQRGTLELFLKATPETFLTVTISSTGIVDSK